MEYHFINRLIEMRKYSIFSIFKVTTKIEFPMSLMFQMTKCQFNLV